MRDNSLAAILRHDVMALIFGGELVAGRRIKEPDVVAQSRGSGLPARKALRELAACIHTG